MHFLALKKKIRPSVQEWDTKMIQIWMSKVGFQRCVRIVKNYGVIGEQIAVADNQYMKDTLGLPDENWCSKFKREIEKVQDSCVEEYVLYGWGNNKYGQLATKKAITIGAPKKIDLPEHIILDETNIDLDSIKVKENIVIEKIFCSNKYSGILLSNGEFWGSGNCAQAGRENIRNLDEERK